MKNIFKKYIFYFIAAAAIIICIITAMIINKSMKVIKFKQSDSDLSDIVIEGYTISPAFDKHTYSYSLDVLDDISSLNISAIPANPDSKVKILGNVGFTKGINLITITVTTPDKITSEYDITINYSPSKSVDTHTKGNYGKNLMNGGIAAIQGDYIYYLSDNGEIYKQKTDGSSKIQLAPSGCSQINIIGDWVYFVNDYTVYSVRTDGTQLHPLLNNKTGKDIYARHLMIYNDIIFYSNAIRDNHGYLYSIPLNYDDATLPTKLTSGISNQFIVFDENIYYINESKSNMVYKIAASGGKTACLIEYSVSSFCIDPENEKLYFLCSNDNTIRKINIDGTEEETFISDVKDFIIDGEYFIYCDTENNTKILSFTDPNYNVTVTENLRTDSYSIVGSYVYFRLYNDDGDTVCCRFLRSYTGNTIEYTRVEKVAEEDPEEQSEVSSEPEE